MYRDQAFESVLLTGKKTARSSRSTGQTTQRNGNTDSGSYTLFIWLIQKTRDQKSMLRQ